MKDTDIQIYLDRAYRTNDPKKLGRLWAWLYEKRGYERVDTGNIFMQRVTLQNSCQKGESYSEIIVCHHVCVGNSISYLKEIIRRERFLSG